jgi:putative transposase
MANKRHKPEEIVTKLRQVDVLVGQGMVRVGAIRQVSIIEQTYYRWRKQYGGMGTGQLKELKNLQKENEQLRRAVSDLTKACPIACVSNGRGLLAMSGLQVRA